MGRLERSARMWLFEVKHLQGQRGKLCFNVTREVCEYLADPQLVHVASTFLRYFHTSTWGPQVPLSTQIQANHGSMWVVLEERVLCCGGGDGSRRWDGITTAYMLARDGAVEPKAHMSVGRREHGLLALHTTLLVFGGSNLSALYIKACEKFQLLTNTWINLPSMKEGRCYFNPCMFWGVIYLCGRGATTMEAFAPDRNTFLPLNITLPEDRSCCLYVDNNLLVVNSENFILKYAVECGGQLILQSRVGSTKVSMYQNSQPVVDRAKGLYFIIYWDACWRLDMQTGVEGPRKT